MSRRLLRRTVATAAVLAMLAFTARVTAQTAGRSSLVVHEWGTFTSIAAEDGTAAKWQPLGGPQDLPCFVEGYPLSPKTWMGTVRMETPVVYFYAPGPMTVSVGVQFRQGVISEWYPHATVTPSGIVNMTPALRGTVDWTDVRVRPGAAERFATEPAASHYYAARATDAAPIEVNGISEKFLFYRGLGGFQPSLSATIAPDGGAIVNSASGEALGDVIAFENLGGEMAYEVRKFSSRRGLFAPLSHNGESIAPTQELERILIAHGLYPKEAKAMVATWRDSWFEEGTRLFYVEPKRFVDDTLPLRITPAPSDVTRVFVGRLELVTPGRLAAVRSALTTRDTVALMRHGRFLQPIADRILATTPESGKRSLLDALTPIYAATFPSTPACQ